MHRVRRPNTQIPAEQAEKAEKDTYIKWLEDTLQRVKADLAHSQQENVDFREGHRVEIETLQEQLKDSQEQLNDSEVLQKQMKPLADVGIAIRLRYIEKFNGAPTYNNTFVADGNRAAHEANLAADMALFDAGILPNDGEHAGAFRNIYDFSPFSMRRLPESLGRAVACRKSWEGEINRGRPNPGLKDLADYGETLYSILWTAYEQARGAAAAERLTWKGFVESTAKKLDEDERSWILVERLELVVVEMYRSTGVVALGKLEPLEDVLNIIRAMPPSSYYGHFTGNWAGMAP